MSVLLPLRLELPLPLIATGLLRRMLLTVPAAARLDRLAIPMLRNENRTGLGRKPSHPKEKNRRANDSSLIVKSFVVSRTE